ncbi:MAG TPA: hypothetical protein VNJ02_13770 [Vicinamibacterales bacterium]|nr:hypothetical protein [Vicinamibacterales bacterium]
MRTRKLEFEVAFLRLPGGSLWFGLRNVKRVDGKAAQSNPHQLEQLLRHFNRTVAAEASAIMAKSAEHNLGGVRQFATSTGLVPQ